MNRTRADRIARLQVEGALARMRIQSHLHAPRVSCERGAPARLAGLFGNRTALSIAALVMPLVAGYVKSPWLRTGLRVLQALSSALAARRRGGPDSG